MLRFALHRDRRGPPGAGPMYLKEMVHRVLQREQYARLLAIAAAEAANNLSRPFSNTCKGT